ncbi:MAG: hypothetical protein A4S14_10430 [Proteobacteria bacterium SG_bin9]|nr:MAG: hypothetical protein A4S14_10430 [Proteobacteria bacterium SG_bin9]
MDMTHSKIDEINFFLLQAVDGLTEVQLAVTLAFKRFSEAYFDAFLVERSASGVSQLDKVGVLIGRYVADESNSLIGEILCDILGSGGAFLLIASTNPKYVVIVAVGPTVACEACIIRRWRHVQDFFVDDISPRTDMPNNNVDFGVLEPKPSVSLAFATDKLYFKTTPEYAAPSVEIGDSEVHAIFQLSADGFGADYHWSRDADLDGSRAGSQRTLCFRNGRSRKDDTGEKNAGKISHRQPL